MPEISKPKIPLDVVADLIHEIKIGWVFICKTYYHVNWHFVTSLAWNVVNTLHQRLMKFPYFFQQYSKFICHYMACTTVVQGNYYKNGMENRRVSIKWKKSHATPKYKVKCIFGHVLQGHYEISSITSENLCIGRSTRVGYRKYGPSCIKNDTRGVWNSPRCKLHFILYINFFACRFGDELYSFLVRMYLTPFHYFHFRNLKNQS